jgi:sulfur carrier protein ThiS
MEPVISVTPDYPDRFRSEEILSWLANNEKKYLLKNWIAIDDIDLAFGTPAMNGHFVHTESNTGLTEALAQLGINLLNGTDRSTAVIAVENDGAVVPPEAMSSQKVIAKLRPKLTTDGQKMKNHDAGSGVQHNSNIAPSVTQLRSRLRALSVPSHKGKFDQMERISTNPPPPTLPRLGNSNANTSAVGRTSRR